MDAIIPFKYSLPGAVSLLSPADGSSAIHHVCFQITTKKSQIFSGIYSIAIYSPSNVTEISSSKGEFKEWCDPPGSGLADPTPPPSCPVPATEPADAGPGHRLSGGHVPDCSQGRTAWPETTWVKPAQRNPRSPRTHSCKDKCWNCLVILTCNQSAFQVHVATSGVRVVLGLAGIELIFF